MKVFIIDEGMELVGAKRVLSGAHSTFEKDRALFTIMCWHERKAFDV